MKNNQHLKYMPGLDGLRAFAVIAIIIFHLNPNWLPGGFLGVDTFFIISGFLITTILLREYKKNGRINLKSFWLKRFKRLFPAVFFMILVVFNFVLIFIPELLEQLKSDIIAALFYVSNWWYIFDEVDYFASFNPRPLEHLWSLAIEEQFYIFFPLVMMVMLSLKSKKVPFIYFSVLALCSGLWMVLLYHPSVQISRLYFGTDTRLQTIILGVLLAFIWPVDRLKVNPGRLIVFLISLFGICGLVTLFYLFFKVSETSSFLYQGGFFIIGLITLVIIASSVHPNSLLMRFLSLNILTTIGRYSYSLYLWHYPVIVLTNHFFVKGQIPLHAYIIEVILTIVFAIFSFKYVETPFRQEGLKYFFKLQSFARVASIVLLLSLTGYSAYQFVTYTAPKDKTIHMTTTHSTVPNPKQLNPVQINDTSEPTVHNYLAPLFIGDSVLVDIYPDLKVHFPNGTIDGEVGRSIYKAIPLADQYTMFNTSDSIVVLGVGTNGDFEENHLNNLLDKFNKAQVYLITTRVPLQYEKHVNTLMYNTANKRNNVHIIDWYEVSKGHPEYFAPDGIHLEYAGIQAMNQLINSELSK